jgi:hypothetical protein
MATMMNYAIVEATAEATARNDARDERAAMGACPGGIDYDEMDEMQFLEKAKELEQRAAQLTFVDVEKQMEALLSSEERAAGVSGDSVKYSAACKVVENRWFRFLAVYGDKLGYEEGSSPSLELVRKFVVYTFKTRTRTRARRARRAWATRRSSRCATCSPSTSFRSCCTTDGLGARKWRLNPSGTGVSAGACY